MKIKLTKKKELHEKDTQIVVVRPPEDFPGPKSVIGFQIGEVVDLDDLVKEKGIKMTGDELGHAIMGDKRYKGLFKIVTSAETNAKKVLNEDGEEEVIANVAAGLKKKYTPTPKKKIPNKAMRTYEDKNLVSDAG